MEEVEEHGGEGEGEKVSGIGIGFDCMPCEPDGEVEDDAHGGGGDDGEGVVEAWVGAGAFDEGCTGEDEEEGGKEGAPAGHAGGEEGHEQWW